MTTPLIGKEQKAEQCNYGYSFNSKRMAMGPAFFNIRIICDCVGRAIRRHMDFSKGHWFLDELNEAKKQRKRELRAQRQGAEPTNIEESGNSNATAFTYQFKEELKIKTTGNKQTISDSDDEFDRNDGSYSIDDAEIDVQNKEEQEKVNGLRQEAYEQSFKPDAEQRGKGKFVDELD